MAVQKDKKIVLFTILLNVVLLPVCFAEPDRMTVREKRAKALELVDKYASTQDKLQSFIYKANGFYESRNNLPLYRQYSGKKYQSYEVRYDGDRTSVRVKQWGNIGGVDRNTGIQEKGSGHYGPKINPAS